MAHQNAIQDQNKFPGLIAHTGTAGTAETVRVIATDGKLLTESSLSLPSKQILIVSALGTAGGSQFGTLSAASGAGTSHVVTGLQVVMHSGTADVYIGFGTALTGGSVLARGKFPEGGGMVRDFSYPLQSGANSEICYGFAGAGTAFIAVNYYKSA